MATALRVRFLLTLVALFVAFLAVPCRASITSSVTFDTLPGGGSLPNGLIVNNQYAALGLSISARNAGGGPDLAVVLDTTLSGTADPDLEDPFTSGNLADCSGATLLDDAVELGNVLIIQENSIGIGDGIANSPDDEGSRPAGSILLDFAAGITQIGFDLIDIEANEVLDSYFASFFSAGDSTPLATVNFNEFLKKEDRTDGLGGVADGFFSDQSEGQVKFDGDNSANRIDPITAADLRSLTGNNAISAFSRVEIRFGGSGAIDNVVFSGEMPELASFATWGVLAMFAGLVGRRSGRG